MSNAGRHMAETTHRKIAMMKKFDIFPTAKRFVTMTTKLMDQVDACRTAECQRIILGITERRKGRTSIPYRDCSESELRRSS